MAKTAEWLQTHYNAASKVQARNTHETNTKTINRYSSAEDTESSTHTHVTNTNNMILDRTLKSK